ncbi:MAG TPA: ADYC domain-containing protein [Kofleriaceae bacterium]|nr:ADYC domain-containing protein [Kofleriaceae bacterium]
MQSRFLYVLPVLVCACSDDSELRLGQITSKMAVINDGSCETLDCGKNGPLIGGVYFAELYKPPLLFDTSVKFNDLGFRIVHYYASRDDWPDSPSDGALDVTLGKFAAVEQWAWIELELQRDRSHYIVEVSDVDNDQPYWTWSPDAAPIESYWFRYTLPKFCTHNAHGTTCSWYRPLCKNKPNDGAIEMPAVVFEGEVYDPAAFTVKDQPMVSPPGVGTWFNIACAGSIPAKMHMIRRTRAAALDPSDEIGMPVPTRDERQAFMNVWAAKYCGPDKSYTENGREIRIRDVHNSLRPDLNVGFTDNDGHTIEAVWGASGALCLNQPRDGMYTQLGVITECGDHGYVLPTCPDDVLDTWTSIPGAFAISATP